MTGDQLSRKLTQLYGVDFHKRVAGELEVDKSTVYRWCKGKVPGTVASWVDMKINSRHGVPRPEVAR